MINDAVEAMFADVFEWPFKDVHKSGGVPTSTFEVGFKKPLFHGDATELQITLTHLGRSSLSFTTRAMRDQNLCFQADQRLVHVDANGRPTVWPEPFVQKFNSLMDTTL